MAATNEQEFRIRDLSTRSVLLFPTRAQIIRDIKNVTLQPGSNKIVIDGLTPTVDEHSIKVEGTGAATISGVAVDLLPTKDLFEDIYPSSDEDEDDVEESDEEVESEAMKTITDSLKQLNVELVDEKEKISSAAQRLDILDTFGRTITKEWTTADELESVVKAYNQERTKVYDTHKAATLSEHQLKEQIENRTKEKTKLAKVLLKGRQKEKKEKDKIIAKKLRQKAEVFKEKQRIKAERQSFWPKKTYRVTITLESTLFTPGSSRRSSVDGDTIVNVPSNTDNNLATTTFHEPSKVAPDEISLSISYVTHSAFWSPRYDLSLDSVKCTGLLEYGAQLTNTTSETWQGAKVVLSTSQTTFSGLNESIPTLHPWSVKLTKGTKAGDGALYSIHEAQAKRFEGMTTSQAHKPRWELFGIDNSIQAAYVHTHAREKEQRKAQLNSQAKEFITRTAPATTSLFGSQSTMPPPPGGAGGLFGGVASRGGAFGAFASMTSPHGFGQSGKVEEEKEESDDDNMGYALFDGPASAAPAPNSLTFEEGKWTDEGMTTTYDVPGTKTLAPSNSTIKHKIAKIGFSNIVYSHIIIGKLRQVAFLKARLRNTSRITLLKGPLGLTLDSSFLGQATFPRCSSGETFSLPLGVDPAIQITYPKPTVRRSQSGIFSKEDSNIFTRTMVINNTKPNSPVQITVLDQIPVSEDERLKIELTVPQGLKPGTGPVRAGVNATEGKDPARNSIGTAAAARATVRSAETGKEISKQGSWGSAEATAKAKGGEVSWAVKLNPGCAVKLALEYELSYPGGESVVNL